MINANLPRIAPSSHSTQMIFRHLGSASRGAGKKTSRSRGHRCYPPGRWLSNFCECFPLFPNDFPAAWQRLHNSL